MRHQLAAGEAVSPDDALHVLQHGHLGIGVDPAREQRNGLLVVHGMTGLLADALHQCGQARIGQVVGEAGTRVREQPVVDERRGARCALDVDDDGGDPGCAHTPILPRG